MTVSIAKEWKPKPWVAAVLGFFLQSIGMLYVARLKWAVVYFFLPLIVIVFEIWLRRNFEVEALRYFSLIWLVLIACSIHAYSIAKRTSPVLLRPWYSHWYGMIGVWLGVLILPVVLVRSFLYEPFRMPSMSMMPTIASGSIMVVQKFGYGNYGTFGISLIKSGPSVEIFRGDLIVFNFPPDPKTRFIKRVIGLPGDKIAFKRGKLMINGKAVETELLGSNQSVEANFVDIRLEKISDDVAYKVFNDHGITSPDRQFEVAQDHYFVLGDNRDHSHDSRYWGSVPVMNIVGKVVYIFQGGFPQ